MNPTRLTQRFRRSASASQAGLPAEAAKPDDKPAAIPAETKAEPVTASAEPAKDVAPAPAAQKGARLVEGERFKPADSAPISEGRTGFPLGGIPAALRPAALKPFAIPAAAAAAIVLALGGGYGLGIRSASEGHEAAQSLQLIQADMTRLAGEISGVKAAVETFKGEREKSRGELLTRQAQLSDKVDRLGQDAAARSGRLADQLEKLDRSHHELARLAGLSDRVEKLEKSASVPVPPAKPVAAASGASSDVTQTGSIGEAKPLADPRKTPIEGYVVRDVDEGFALVETKSGRFLEVAVGYTLPGIGRVEAIERRGRQWVVVTPKGFIAER